MKHLSLNLLAETVVIRRKALKLSQAALSEKTGINRSILSRLETEDYTPNHTDVGLDYAYNLIGYVGIHIIRNRDTQITVLDHLHSEIHRLE